MSTTVKFDANFTGELIRPDDPGYDTARQLFNGAIDKRPALIARCTGPEDVQAALAHAREHGLTVAVRGGGHSAIGYSSCDDGIVIDTGPMKNVDIDVDARTGRFGAGLTWGELDAATQLHGLAVTGGRVTHTGVAGLTLGSGSGAKGLNGWLRVSMYRIASVSFLASSICATFAPRWRPRRRLVRCSAPDRAGARTPRSRPPSAPSANISGRAWRAVRIGRSRRTGLRVGTGRCTRSA